LVRSFVRKDSPDVPAFQEHVQAQENALRLKHAKSYGDQALNLPVFPWAGARQRRDIATAQCHGLQGSCGTQSVPECVESQKLS
jgi:hypothetical protein